MMPDTLSFVPRSQRHIGMAGPYEIRRGDALHLCDRHGSRVVLTDYEQIRLALLLDQGRDFTTTLDPDEAPFDVIARYENGTLHLGDPHRVSLAGEALTALRTALRSLDEID